MNTGRSNRGELYRDSASRWRWRFVSNGRVLADSGQSYSRHIDAVNGLGILLGGIYLPGDGDALATVYAEGVREVPVRELPTEPSTEQGGTP